MEKNLNKYLTLDEAGKQNYITAQMIALMVEKNLIPYFNDKGVIRVFPGDIQTAISEIFGVIEEKKTRKKPPTPEVVEEQQPEVA